MSSSLDPDLRNSGVAILNPAAPLPPEHTVLVLGVARSGTSMVARVLHRLGIAPAGKAGEVVFEDNVLSRQIQRGEPGQWRETIRSYNDANPVWFFKRPALLNHLPQLETEFRNPVYVAVFRDLLSIAIRERISNQVALGDALKRAQGQYRKLLAVIETTRRPMLLLSYEKAMQAPQDTVAAVAGFLGIDDGKRIAAAAAAIEPNRPAYLERARRT